MDVVLRSDVPPLSLARAVEQSVHQLDPNVPVSSLRTVQQLVAESISQPRFYVSFSAALPASRWCSPSSASSA